VIRFEHLQDDFDALLVRVDAPPVEVPRRNVTVAKAEAGRHWREYYSPRTRDVVARVYRDWIERFGYTFDDPEEDGVAYGA
jgi:hypothetical protein